MRILLDSHIFLWWLNDSTTLSKEGRKLIRDAERVYVSAATFTELGIKMSLEKLTVNHDLIAELELNDFEKLDITPEHGIFLKDLPMLHKDPFDRLLIAQAKLENLTLITADTIMEQYDAPMIIV